MPGKISSSSTPHGLIPFVVGALVGYGSAFLCMSFVIGRGNRASLGWTKAGGIMANTKEAARPRVVCFGDSLTQQGFDAERLGWLALLANWWERRFDVINRGFSGYNTRWLLPLVDRLFVPDGVAPTKLVTIFLGANDCTLPGISQHVPIEEYKDNLRQMVQHVRRVLPRAKLLLITPPSIHEAKWAEDRRMKSREMGRKLEVTMAYAEACKEVGKQTSVRVVDTFSATGSGDVALADKFFRDGLHFTSEGNRVMFEAIQKEILLSFPELDPERVDKQAPHHGDVDPDNYRESVLGSL